MPCLVNIHMQSEGYVCDAETKHHAGTLTRFNNSVNFDVTKLSVIANYITI